MWGPKRYTKEGFESQLGVNHLGINIFQRFVGKILLLRWDSDPSEQIGAAGVGPELN